MKKTCLLFNYLSLLFPLLLPVVSFKELLLSATALEERDKMKAPVALCQPSLTLPSPLTFIINNEGN